jgi:hypothetical protein
MKTKRIGKMIAILMAALMMIGLTACGGGNNDKAADGATEAADSKEVREGQEGAAGQAAPEPEHSDSNQDSKDTPFLLHMQ